MHLPKVVQNEFHPLQKRNDEFLKFCEDNGIAFQAHSSLGAGSEHLLENSVVKEIAKEKNMSPAIVLFRYGLQCGAKIIVKSDKVEVSKLYAEAATRD